MGMDAVGSECLTELLPGKEGIIEERVVEGAERSLIEEP